MPYGQYFAVAEEPSSSGWGVAVARTKMAKVHAGSFINPKANRTKSAKLSSNLGADPEANFDKGQHGLGKIICPMSFDDGAGFKLLKHLLGNVASTTGSGPYVHTLNRLVGPPFSGGAVPTAVGLSAELNYELPDAGLPARLLAGSRVMSGTFAWNAEEEVVLDCDLIGKECTQVAKTASPVFPDYDNLEMKFQQIGLSIGGVQFGAVCSGIDFTINNGHEPRVRLGDIFTKAPLRRGSADLAGNIHIDWEAAPSAKTLFDAFKANTSTEIIVTITGPSGYSMVVTMSRCFFNANDLNPDEGQLQAADIPFLAYNHATNTACKVVITSPNATI